MSRLPNAFQLELPLRSLLQAPTIAGLGAEIVQHGKKQEETQASVLTLPTIVPAPEQRHHPFPLTDMQQAYWIGRADSLS